MRALTLSEVLGSEDEFFSEYFNRKPWLRRAAVEGDSRAVLSLGDLDHLLHAEVIRPPYIDITKGGSRVFEKTYTSQLRVQTDYVNDAIVPEHVIEHFRTGATITWNSLNHFLPTMRTFAGKLGERFSCRSDVVAFVTPAGRRGFSPHYDSVEVFVIQLEGTKHWKVWPTGPERPGDAQWFTMEELGEPVIETSLEPGDVLYLPYNTPHVAASDDNVSLHLSVMVRPRHWRDLVAEVVQSVVAADPEFGDFPLLSAEREEELTVKLRDQLVALSNRCAKLDLRRTVRDLVSSPIQQVGAKVGTFFADQSRIDHITSMTMVMKVPSTPIDVVGAAPEDTLRVEVNGHKFNFPRLLVEEVRTMESARSAGRLVAEYDQDTNVQLARACARIGLLDTVQG
ncbi:MULTISPECIES: cupin domain-containing protein [unclassified Crossiella]|uniref:cupin domain-containing protein n=1 Tax=unclassified Crossiella TaxID=2620835 RepID=UPI001FFEE7DB|nr:MULTISPECIES: cupin domain-containing protein [unclassified Crossiella]MCK2244327.1 cupin domain-containing protein [Crossiella sp. S99.2]MCK2257845.1 cupin domain-containing protein [Crossiella sp. S99.1]